MLAERHPDMRTILIRCLIAEVCDSVTDKPVFLSAGPEVLWPSAAPSQTRLVRPVGRPAWLQSQGLGKLSVQKVPFLTKTLPRSELHGFAGAS